MRLRGRAAIARIGLAAAALAALLAAAWVALLAVIYTTYFQSPDPNQALDGDPCCAHPDTWTDVIIGGVYFSAVTVASLGFLTLGIVLGWSALRGGVPTPVRRRARALWRAGIVASACALAVPASWVIWPLFE